MTREIKFRAWDITEELMYYFDFYDIEKPNGSVLGGQILRKCGDGIERYFPLHRQPVMQFTGLKDKNGLKEVYEGDIIDVGGNIKGNIYENNKEETDLVIQGLGTSSWEATNKEALVRGCKYSE